MSGRKPPDRLQQRHALHVGCVRSAVEPLSTTLEHHTTHIPKRCLIAGAFDSPRPAQAQVNAHQGTLNGCLAQGCKKKSVFGASLAGFLPIGPQVEAATEAHNARLGTAPGAASRTCQLLQAVQSTNSSETTRNQSCCGATRQQQLQWLQKSRPNMFRSTKGREKAGTAPPNLRTYTAWPRAGKKQPKACGNLSKHGQRKQGPSITRQKTSN